MMPPRGCTLRKRTRAKIQEYASNWIASLGNMGKGRVLALLRYQNQLCQKGIARFR